MATTKNRKKNRKKTSGNRSSSAKYRQAVLTRATESLLNCKVTGIEFPGGKSRESCRMLLDGAESVIATRRDNLDRARVEVQTLRALNRHAAPVPALLGTNHSHILIQQEIRGQRLSQALKDADEGTCRDLLASALSSLEKVHKAATKEQLETIVVALGNEEEWVRSLLGRPKVIGDYLDVRAPSLDKAALVHLLRVETARFIKWDSRPGNALVNDQGDVIWFDWEHAGKRNRLDDMAWVLGDEFVPDDPTIEEALIEQFVPAFADLRTVDEARQYLYAFGTFHMVIRLGLILKYMDGEWWDLEHCIDGDKVGVTLLCGQRICRRGARWSRQHPLTQMLAPWFEQVEKHLETL